ncbi:MAG: endonuclease [Ardenticatenales bacterium]|nr:endonuclease [Ardenticatenales bacterium]
MATRILTETEEDPATPENVIDIYFGESMNKVAKIGTPRRPWDIEHVWPSSRGFAEEGACNVPLSDAHHLFAAHPIANGSSGHSNHPFDDCHHDCTPMPSGTPSPNQNQRGEDADGRDVFEVWIERRGDIARALFYMDVRYDGGPTSAVMPSAGACDDEPKLQLGENVPESSGGPPFDEIVRYGRLSTLVRWALQDQVDGRERRRNDIIGRRDMQGNRNPFIDDSGLICRMYPVGPCRPLFLPSVVRP